MLKTYLILFLNLLFWSQIIFAQQPTVTKIENLPEGVKNINCIEIENNSVWIGTNKGLLNITGNKVEINVEAKKPDLFKINYIFIDQDGVKWLGNYNNCIIRFEAPGRYEVIDFSDVTQHPIGLITNIHKYGNTVWATSSSSNILQYNVDTKEKKSINGPEESSLYAFAIANNRTYWIAAPSGLLSTSNFLKWKNEKNIAQAISIYNHNGNLLALGRNVDSESLLLKYDIRKNKWKPVELTNLPDKYIKFNDLFVDNADNYWIASNYGIIQYSSSNERCYFLNERNTKDFELREVKCIAVQNIATVWVSSTGADLYKIEL